ncbi:hypothetical protein HK101_004910 [Irineochytrium annulatum]|nr:hypothetical protein HK101_004910 [Irineochytrium annulatum]
MRFFTVLALAATASAQGIVEDLSKYLGDGVDGIAVNTLVALVVSAFFSILRTLLKATDLLSTLASAKAPITIFAPTDAAFKNTLPAGFNTSDVNAVATVIKYHVSSTLYPSTNPAPQTFISTLEGEEVGLSYASSGVTVEFGLGSAKVLKSDSILDGQGFIHFVDHVLLPPASVTETAAQVKNLSSLVAAITSIAGLAATVDGLKDITVLAPTDEAFAAIASVAATLTPEQLTAVLELHIVKGTFFSTDLVKAVPLSGVATVDGAETLAVTANNGSLFVAGAGNKSPAKVVIADVITNSGVVHVIDTVLLPTSLPAATTNSGPVSTTPAKPSSSSTAGNYVVNGATAIAPAGALAAAAAVAALFL